jgi:hypothetical protein
MNSKRAGDGSLFYFAGRADLPLRPNFINEHGEAAFHFSPRELCARREEWAKRQLCSTIYEMISK